MTHRIRKHISRLAHAPMEGVRRRQAERTPISTIGLNLPIAYHNELQTEPTLEQTIDFLRQQPDGDHYLAEVALLPAQFAMARRALRAISDQPTQVLATARVLEQHQDNTGTLDSFWKRRLRRHIAKVATRLVSVADPDLKTIRTLGHVGNAVELPKDVTEVVADQDRTFREMDDVNVTRILLERLGGDLAEQIEEARTERYDPFADE